jgi:site-specific recombinase XerD
MINRVSKSKKLFKYLDKTKVEEILERARDNKRDYLLILTLWRTGIRNSELISLKKRDIKSDRIIIHQGKGKKDRWVPLDKNLRTLLEYHTANMNLDERIFPISTVQVRNIVHKYQGDEYVKPHTFRHSFAVYCLKSGMNIRSLQKILGHADLNTTAVYLDLIGKDIITDFNKIEW